MKKVLWAIAALLLVGGIILWRVIANLDVFVAGLIEDSGTRALGTEVSVTGVQIDLRGARATVSGLTIANPAGWTAPYAFELDRISVALDLQSLNSPVLVLKGVNVDASKVALEIRADGSSNLQTLLDGIDSPAEQAPAPGEGDDPLRVRIDELTVGGITLDVAVESPEPGGGVDRREIGLPPIELYRVGGPEGAPPQTIAAAIGAEMIAVVLEEAAREGISRFLERKKDDLQERLSEKLNELIKQP